jgi:hypothetical protein
MDVGILLEENLDLRRRSNRIESGNTLQKLHVRKDKILVRGNRRAANANNGHRRRANRESLAKN